VPGESTQDILRRYRRTISLLRFFRRINKIGEVDKFASAPDPDTAIRILKDLISWVERNVTERNGQKICFEEEIRQEEKAAYEYLCGKECIDASGGKIRVRVRCPALPSQTELLELYNDIREGRVRPELIAALALARAR